MVQFHPTARSKRTAARAQAAQEAPPNMSLSSGWSTMWSVGKFRARHSWNVWYCLVTVMRIWKVAPPLTCTSSDPRTEIFYWQESWVLASMSTKQHNRTLRLSLTVRPVNQILKKFALWALLSLPITAEEFMRAPVLSAQRQHFSGTVRSLQESEATKLMTL